MKNIQHTFWRHLLAALLLIAAGTFTCAASGKSTNTYGKTDVAKEKTDNKSTANGGKQFCTVADNELSLRAKPGFHTKITHRLGKTAKLEYIGRKGFWAKAVWKGDTCYAQLNSLTFSENVKATLPAWANLDETHGKWGDLGYYFSTDRIMEALPDIQIWKHNVPIDPDLCFDIAFWILLITGIAFPFVQGMISFGNVGYWAVYILAMVTAACEIIYITASPDPLGFCDVNNVWWPKAWFFVLLVGLSLYQQLKLFSTILFTTQEGANFNFKAGLSVKLMMLCAVYFVVSVVAYFFDGIFPEKWNIAVLCLPFLPVLLMTYRAVRNVDVLTWIVLVPFYLLVGAATLALYCLMGMVFAVLMFLFLVIQLCGDDIVYGKKNGVWYYMDYDTWFEHRSEFTHTSFSNPFTKY